MSWDSTAPDNTIDEDDDDLREPNAAKKVYYWILNTWPGRIVAVIVGIAIAVPAMFFVQQATQEYKPASDDSTSIVIGKSVRDGEGPSLFVGDKDNQNGTWIVVDEKTYNSIDFGDEYVAKK